MNEVLRLFVRFKTTLQKIVLPLYNELKFLLLTNSKKHLEINEALIAGFIALNKKHWQAEEKATEKEIWIEGHIAEYGPNYLLRTAVVAKALQQTNGNNIRVVFNVHRYQWRGAPRMYRSFGINRFLFIGSHFIFKNIQFERKAYFLAKQCWSEIKTGQDILKISYQGVLFGDLIYDDIIKNSSGLYTIDKPQNYFFTFIEKAFYYYLQYDTLFKTHKVSDFVSTHTAYSEYGLLVRVALKNGVTVYETTDMHLALFLPDHGSLATYHEGFNRLLTTNWNKLKDDDPKTKEFIAHYQDHLERRLSGQINQVDVLLAFANKRIYDQQLLRSTLGITNSKPLVFIMCHAFSDSPHISSWQMYNDYYDWLLQTLQLVKNLDNVNWIIKPHPSVALYNEDGAVGNIVREHANKNIFLTPEDFNTSSLKNCAHAILTVQGTVGIEFSCYGIPTILTGKPFFAGLGFTIEPKTKHEYEQLLNDIHNLKKLSDIEIYRAQKAYALYNDQLLIENSIISVDVLNNVWGYKDGRDINKAYSIINENLKNNSPLDLPVYKRALMLAKQQIG